jgi:HK97 family phage prohead protease
MTVVMKALAVVETVETENPNGAFDVVLSAPTLDRDGEVIDSRAFDPLPDHIPFDIDHSMTVTGTVGSGTPYYDEAGLLRVKGTFASTPLGQEVRTLVSEGHIRTTSVTFMAAKRAKDEKGVDHVQTAELLNGTFTPVPSNREAVVLSAKALGAVVEEKVGARNSASDAATIQSMHDAATSLGASCSTKSVKALGDTTEESPATLALAVDATIDSMEAVLDGIDTAAWPAEAQQLVSLVTAADTAVDTLLTSLGATDPDDATESADDTAPAAASAAADAVKSADEDAVEARAYLALSENAALLAFGA